MAEWEKAGEIGVDAGLCWIGDPCYVRGGEQHALSDWDAFCSALYPGNPYRRGAEGEPPKSQMEEKSYQVFQEGIVTGTGVGDGLYPVYVRRDNGQIAEVRIVFIEDEHSPKEE